MNSFAEKFYGDLYSTQEINEADCSKYLNYWKSLPEWNKVNYRITPEEILDTLRFTANTSPGPDGISYAFFLHKLVLFPLYITDLFNYCLSRGHIPDYWKIGVVITL